MWIFDSGQRGMVRNVGFNGDSFRPRNLSGHVSYRSHVRHEMVVLIFPASTAVAESCGYLAWAHIVLRAVLALSGCFVLALPFLTRSIPTPCSRQFRLEMVVHTMLASATDAARARRHFGKGQLILGRYWRRLEFRTGLADRIFL